MRRPVVNKDIVDYMRTHLQENKGHLAELEAFARKENIPIIQHEVVAYFRFLLQTLLLSLIHISEPTRPY